MQIHRQNPMQDAVIVLFSIILVLSYLLIFVLLVSMVLPTVFAAQDVSYTVNAFALDRFYNQSPNNYDIQTSTVACYKGDAITVFGIRIAIPPNQLSGYFVAAGMNPVLGNSLPTMSNGWYTSGFTYKYVSASYYLSTSPNIIEFDFSERIGESFNGVLYIPAHTQTLYLFIYSCVPEGVLFAGGSSTSGKIIQFVPDSSDSATMIAEIIEIRDYVERIYNLMLTTAEQNASAQEALDQMQRTLDEIQSLVEEINNNTNRPPPADILPTINPAYTNPTDPAAQFALRSISNLMQKQVILDLMLIVIGLAFVRFVLFGRRT